ncbi:hypothetical protein D3C75_1330480 [compost metagenome]
MGSNLIESVAMTVLGINLIDKVLVAIIVWLLVRNMSQRTLRNFPAMAAMR